MTEIFDENSNINRADQGARECGICHVSTNRLGPYKGNESNDSTGIEVCEVCNGLYDLGKALIDDKEVSLLFFQKKRKGRTEQCRFPRVPVYAGLQQLLQMI